MISTPAEERIRSKRLVLDSKQSHRFQAQLPSRMPRSYAAALCVQLATALFAGHPRKFRSNHRVNVAIEPPPTTLGGPAAPRAKQNLAEEWNLADRVRAASVPSPTDGRRHVAWRRLARQSGDDAETLRARWAACGHAGLAGPMEPAFARAVGGGRRPASEGAADGEAVQLALAVGGGDECRVATGAGVVETASGASLRARRAVRFPGIEAMAAAGHRAPCCRGAEAGLAPGRREVADGLVRGAAAVAAPAALGALAVAAGVLTVGHRAPCCRRRSITSGRSRRPPAGGEAHLGRTSLQVALANPRPFASARSGPCVAHEPVPLAGALHLVAHE